SQTTYRNIGLFDNAINIATAIVFATLSIPIVWSLWVNPRTKISLIAVPSL
ncbi:hypothetical protein K469DRAFT_478793, partial [Zopfia rhizophila CBS 207.26]